MADIAVVNLGLFLGVLARYVVLVGLSKPPNIPPYYATPETLPASRAANVGTKLIVSIFTSGSSGKVGVIWP